MPSSFATMFCKTVFCPSSQALLAYHRSHHALKDKAHIEAHLASCDFCSAELQLLTQHRNDIEECASVEMPVQLRRLAEDLLRRSAAPLKGFAEFNEHYQLSH
jgi:hypothetical protein